MARTSVSTLESLRVKNTVFQTMLCRKCSKQKNEIWKLLFIFAVFQQSRIFLPQSVCYKQINNNNNNNNNNNKYLWFEEIEGIQGQQMKERLKKNKQRD